MSVKQHFTFCLTAADVRRLKVASALEGVGFANMIVLLVREGLNRRGVKESKEEAP